VAAFQGIEQKLEGYSRPAKNGRSAQDIRIFNDHAVPGTHKVSITDSIALSSGAPVLRQIVCALKKVQPASTAVLSRLSLHPREPRISPGGTREVYVYVLRIAEPGRFHDATLVRIRQPYRTGGASLPVVRGKGRDLRLWCEFFRLAFPSPVRDACGPRGSSEYTPRAGVLGGVRQLR